MGRFYKVTFVTFAKKHLPELCERLSVGQNIIVQVANNEQLDNPNEEYVVGKIEGKAIKLEGGHAVQCISKRMTELFMCAGIMLFLQKRTWVMIDFIKKEPHEIQSLKDAGVLK